MTILNVDRKLRGAFTVVKVLSTKLREDQTMEEGTYYKNRQQSSSYESLDPKTPIEMGTLSELLRTES